MFEFLKKNRKKQPEKSDRLSATEQKGDFEPDKKYEPRSAETSHVHGKRKLTFHEEQYLRMQKIMEEKEEAAFEEFRKMQGEKTTKRERHTVSKVSFWSSLTMMLASGFSSVSKVVYSCVNSVSKPGLVMPVAIGLLILSVILYLWGNLK